MEDLNGNFQRERWKSADFLDLTLSFKLNGTFKIKLFKKNVISISTFLPTQHIQPTSAGVLPGLITGTMMEQIYQLTTDAADQHSSGIDLFHHLLVLGHQASDILPMFKTALIAATKPLAVSTSDYCRRCF